MTRADRWFAAACGCGFVVRLVWVVGWARTPTDPFTDSAHYLRIVTEIAHLEQPTFLGDPSAYWQLGYPLLLAPLVAVGQATGAFGPMVAAAAVNLLAGTATVALAALLARHWFGTSAMVATAWLLALFPTQIVLTSTPTAEVVFTSAFLAGAVCLSTAFGSGTVRPPWPLVVLLGAVAGYAAVIRVQGWMLLLVPFLAVRATTGRWRGAGWSVPLLLVGVLVVVAPVTVRNGLAVGHWSPAATTNAVAACAGHRDGADGGYDTTRSELSLALDCYRNSPWDEEGRIPPEWVPAGWTYDGVDEPLWYRRTMLEAARWAVTHPVDEVRLTFWKTFGTLGTEDTNLLVALNADGNRLPGPRALRVAVAVFDAYSWIVLVLALVAFRTRAARRASPVWGLALAVLVTIWGSVAQAHYDFPVQPLLCVLAGSALAAAKAVGSSAGAPADAVSATGP